MITIVIPCYNEAQRLNSEVFIQTLQENNEIGFLFVDDGSVDSTLELIEDIEKTGGKDRVSHLHFKRNQGKAEAVRKGMLHALKFSNSYIGYWDADLATPLSEIENFAHILETKNDVQVVCGARIQRLGANINRHWYRHYPGRLIATCISLMLGLPVYDTQCGAKLLSHSLVQELFEEPFISPWLFDVEVIARLIQIKGRGSVKNTLYEYPLNSWQDVGESKISFSYLPKIPIELARIRHHYRACLR